MYDRLVVIQHKGKGSMHCKNNYRLEDEINKGKLSND